MIPTQHNMISMYCSQHSAHHKADEHPVQRRRQLLVVDCVEREEDHCGTHAGRAGGESDTAVRCPLWHVTRQQGVALSRARQAELAHGVCYSIEAFRSIRNKPFCSSARTRDERDEEGPEREPGLHGEEPEERGGDVPQVQQHARHMAWQVKEAGAVKQRHAARLGGREEAKGGGNDAAAAGGVSRRRRRRRQGGELGRGADRSHGC